MVWVMAIYTKETRSIARRTLVIAEYLGGLRYRRSTVRGIARATGLSEASIRKTLREMRKSGEVRLIGANRVNTASWVLER